MLDFIFGLVLKLLNWELFDVKYGFVVVCVMCGVSW